MSKKKTTLLVVDAEPQTRKMLESVLDRSDFKVEECLTGKQATKLAMSLKPDLVLLDLNLPDMQGNEVITSLRAWSQAPIIILSARATTEDIATALRESTTASSNVDRRVDLVSLQLGQETTNYAFHKCIVEGLPREPASVEEGRDD
jgi:two-component system KDP operon response regulator KdpE